MRRIKSRLLHEVEGKSEQPETSKTAPLQTTQECGTQPVSPLGRYLASLPSCIEARKMFQPNGQRNRNDGGELLPLSHRYSAILQAWVFDQDTNRNGSA
jgi:hypothetical protein